MPNTNTQAIRVANEKLRPAADRFGQLYNFCKALQAEYQAESWTTLFSPNDATVLSDGADVDGRAPITNADVNNLMTLVGNFITWMEATSNANRNLTLRIAVNPERY